MPARLRVIEAGAGATMQDAGRRGFFRYGVTESGPMDWIAYETATRALKNPGAACVEIALGGIAFACEDAPVRIAYAGGAFAWALNGVRLPRAAVVRLRPGDRATVKPGPWGAGTYLAIEGGFDVPVVLGSRSTHTRSGIGGFQGRTLAAGDVLPALPPAADSRDETGTIDAARLDRPPETVRVVLGPQDDYFTAESLDAFFGATYAISPKFDRMGYWLNGTRLEHKAGFDIVSDGIAFGAIQVPGEGFPLVLLADHQTTGGYPKIGTVIRSDVGSFAQHRAGEKVRFIRCGVEEARELLLAVHEELEKPVVLNPLGPFAADETLLSSSNLIGGVVDALSSRA